MARHIDFTILTIQKPSAMKSAIETFQGTLTITTFEECGFIPVSNSQVMYWIQYQ